MLDLTLYDASIEAMAFLLDQDVRETRAATSTEGQIQRVGMSRPATMREYTMVVRGSAVQDPDATEVRAGQFVVPRGRIISPWERNQSVAEWVKTPVQIVALVDYSPGQRARAGSGGSRSSARPRKFGRRRYGMSPAADPSHSAVEGAQHVQ